MPKEVIAASDDGDRLEVSWTKHDDLDPMIGIGSWRPDFNPDGTYGGWEPSGPQWALTPEAVDRMIKVLRRARDQVYKETDPAPATKILVEGSVLNAKDITVIVQQELRKLAMRNTILGLGGVGSDHD